MNCGACRCIGLGACVVAAWPAPCMEQQKLNGAPLHVLLVEDEAMIGEAIQRALTGASHAADGVKSCHTALKTLGGQDYVPHSG